MAAPCRQRRSSVHSTAPAIPAVDVAVKPTMTGHPREHSGDQQRDCHRLSVGLCGGCGCGEEKKICERKVVHSAVNGMRRMYAKLNLAFLALLNFSKKKM